MTWGTARDAAAALGNARLQAAARWRGARGGAAVFGWVTFAFALLTFNAAARAGDTVRALADGTDSTVNVYASAWVRSWASGALIDSLGGAILGVLALAIVTPAFIPTERGLIPAEHSAGWPMRRMSRYVGSVYTQMVSLACVLGLFVLTGVASMLTLDGTGRDGGLLIGWTVWSAGLFAGPVVMWGRELISRRRWNRAAVAGLVVVGGVVLTEVLTHRVATLHLFYVGQLVVHLSALPAWGIAASGLVLNATLVWAGYLLCGAALALPAPVMVHKPCKPRALSVRLNRAYLQATIRTIVRTRSLIQQLAGLACVGVALAFTVHGTVPSAAALVVTIPVGVVVAWQVNSLAILSSSGGWVGSRPHLAARTLPVHTEVGGCLLAVIAGAALTVAISTGRLPWADVPAVAVALVVAGIWACAAAATFAITRPRRADVHDGHPLLPAVTTVAYTLTLMLGPGLVAALLTVGPTWWTTDQPSTVDLTDTWPLAAILAAVGAAWLVIVHWVWAHTPTLRARALLAVTN